METMTCWDRSSRNQLIVDHTEATRRVAIRMAKRCPTWILREDLISAGMVGLIEAADRYDVGREEPVWVFAEHRIRGAVLDELRRGDILPRRVRQLARKIAQVIQKLEQTDGLPPSDEKVANELGMSIDAYRDDTWAVRNHQVSPLTAADHVAADHELGAPDDIAAHNRTLAQVKTALDGLEPRDVRILGMHFLEEMSFSQIATEIGVTPSRVCQLLWRAVDRLRSALGMSMLEAA
jgi:RNA polymerase sigma factor for flagellar operon FliA